MSAVIGLISCHFLVIPALELWLQGFTTVVHGLVECRVEMECTFEILNLRKFPLVVGTNNNVCTQIVYKVPVSIVKITLQEDHRSRRFLIRKDLLEEFAGVIPYSEEVLISSQYDGFGVADDVSVHAGFSHPGG